MRYAWSRGSWQADNQPAPSSYFYFPPSLIFSSISRTFYVTESPTPIFGLSRFNSFLLFVIVPTAKLLVDLGDGSGWRLW